MRVEFKLFGGRSARARTVVALGMCLLLSSVPAWAAVSVSYQSAAAQGAYTVSNSDLINSNSPALLSTTHTGYTPFTFDGGTSTTAALNDGFQGISYVSGNGALSSGAFDLDGIWSSTFFLSASYDINQIETVASWPAARASQAYTVSYRQTGNPLFTPLTTIEYLVSPNQSSKVVISDTGGVLAYNVDAIRFDFFVASGSASSKETVYREADVFGTLVPEPSAAGLLLLGGMALWLGRFKKR
jgi:hypothetical protein